jgi:hypothetical protein
MNQDLSPVSPAFDMPTEALRWPHLQRLAERWLRIWGFAFVGLAVGLCGVWLTQTEVSDDHEQAVQAVSGLQQQLATLPGVLSAKPEKPLSSVEQNMLASLPSLNRQEQIWADVQQALNQHGLHLLSLRPMPPTGADARYGGLFSQAMTVQLRGRFEDWARMWAACTLTGPLCTMDRISVLATAHTDEVQIDAVLRIWMRPSEVGVLEGFGHGALFAPVSGEQRPPVHRGAALFSTVKAVAVPAAGEALRGNSTTDHKPLLATGAEGASVLAALSEDPRQWPLERVRLVGLWRQGPQRQAILSAGPHWTRVVQGQHVTLEGHRVVAITDEGVTLRRAQEPLVRLHWNETTSNSKTGEGKKR